MPKLFDVCTVHFKREWHRIWPFSVAVATGFTVNHYLSLKFTDENAEKSALAQTTEA